MKFKTKFIIICGAILLLELAFFAFAIHKNGLPNLGAGDKLPMANELTAISDKLKNKTPDEKSNIKGEEIAKIDFKEEVTKDDIKFKVVKMNKIEKGVEFFVQAWKNDNPVGFGKDGTVEIERIRIINPPVLVEDKDGTIISESVDVDREGKETVTTTKYREDPKEAMYQSLLETIKTIAKDGKDIVKGKVGNTTTTVYMPATSAYLRLNNATSWSNFRDATDATLVYNTYAYMYATCEVWTTYYYGGRSWLWFDTSDVGGDTISSAVIKIYGNNKYSGGNAGYQFVTIAESTKEDTGAIVVEDWDETTDTELLDAGDRPAVSTFSTIAYTDFPLNTAGIAQINGADYSYFVWRVGHDMLDSAPTTGEAGIRAYSAYEAGTTKDPYIVIEHAGGAPPATPAPIPEILFFN